MSISVVAALLNRGSVFCANFEFGVPEPMWDALARTIVGADDRREPVCPLLALFGLGSMSELSP